MISGLFMLQFSSLHRRSFQHRGLHWRADMKRPFCPLGFSLLSFFMPFWREVSFHPSAELVLKDGRHAHSPLSIRSKLSCQRPHTHHRKWGILTGACGAQVALRSVTDSKSSRRENKLLWQRTSSEVDSCSPSDISFIHSCVTPLPPSSLTHRILYISLICMKYTMQRESVIRLAKGLCGAE